MKKIIKIILAILIIYFIAITINNIYVMNIWGLNKKGDMSEKEIVELLEKGTTNKNYTYSRNFYSEYDTNALLDIYVKDNIISAYYLGRPYYWVDFDNEETMLFENSLGPIVLIDNTSYPYLSDKLVLSLGEVMEPWNKSKYLGETKINDRDTVVIETIHVLQDYENANFLNKIYNFCSKEFYFIDKETGILVRHQSSGGLRIRKLLIIEKWVDDYNVKFDCVTDKYVERPNLEGYTIQYEKIHNLY